MRTGQPVRIFFVCPYRSDSSLQLLTFSVNSFLWWSFGSTESPLPERQAREQSLDKLKKSLEQSQANALFEIGMVGDERDKILRQLITHMH